MGTKGKSTKLHKTTEISGTTHAKSGEKKKKEKPLTEARKNKKEKKAVQPKKTLQIKTL